jgi:ubiquinone/menaquinone biosynthesis C-methylase UbiE
MMQSDRETLRAQYADATNLNARSAIYRFGDPRATPWPRWVFDQLDLPGSARVLEIGCGDGGLWKRNLDRLPGGWRIVMFDLSAGMLAASRTALPATHFVGFVQGDAERLPVMDGHFDAVVANHMLYHVTDRARALREIRRVLAPGGKLFAGTNSESHLVPMKDLIEEFLGEAAPFDGHMPFSMENGAAAIAGAFATVESRFVRGQLRVTDPEAIVRYVMSVEGARERITSARLDDLRRRAASEIETNGAFILPTAAGMFVASD